MWLLSCCVRALLCERDMIKHHLRLWYWCTLMNSCMKQITAAAFYIVIGYFLLTYMDNWS